MLDTTKRTDGASTVATEDELHSRSRNVNWYAKELGDVPDDIREVLEGYSKVPPDQVREHVFTQREKGWGEHFRTNVFLAALVSQTLTNLLVLHHMPQYPDIVSRVQRGDKFIDLGCCFGQEIRRLIYDGAPAENLYGSDLRHEFVDLGYDLFRDRETCKATIFAADAFDEAPSSRLFALRGTMSVVCTNAFFHLFDRPEQLQLAKRVVTLFKPEPGVMVVGRQVGSIQPGAYSHATNGKGGIMWRHDVATWTALWDEVGEATGTKWKVEGELRDAERRVDSKLIDANVRELRFCVTRL